MMQTLCLQMLYVKQLIHYLKGNLEMRDACHVRGGPIGQMKNGRRARKIFSDVEINIKEMDLKLIELIWYLQESITNYSAGRVKQLSSIKKPKIAKSQG